MCNGLEKYSGTGDSLIDLAIQNDSKIFFEMKFTFTL
jgi:hypothetical protein